MMINKFLNGVFVCLIILLIGGGLVGCSTKVQPGPDEIMSKELNGAPDWVAKGCNSYWKSDEGKKTICGVGSVGGTSNPTLARDAAIGRARADIAKKLQVNVNSMLKDYQATTTGGTHFGTNAADEQHIEDISKQVTDVNLSGSELVDSWISENGTYYVLVALDTKKFKDNVNHMGNLPESLRKAIIERADKSFDELYKTIETERK